jgi:hypothetical protein
MKNTIKIMAFVSLIILVNVIQSCSDESSEPALAQAKLEMKAVSAQSTIKTGRVQATGLEFTQVLIGVTEMEFETFEENDLEDSGEFEDNDSDGEDDNEEIEFEGNFVVDLISGTSNPDFGLADLAPGIYEEMEIEMGPILEGGNTMFVAFNYVPDGATDTVRVEYSNKQEIEFELESDTGFTLEGGTINKMLILINLDALFESIDLSSATADSDGVIRINSTSNESLASTIESNLDTMIEGGEDKDDDGEIDD